MQFCKTAGTKSNMKTGELVHAESAVPASQKLEVFGPVDSSSFRGLGLAQALADHLEGRVSDLLKDQGSICQPKTHGVTTSWSVDLTVSATAANVLVGFAEINFVTPTRIQQSAIPVLLVIHSSSHRSQANGSDIFTEAWRHQCSMSTCVHATEGPRRACQCAYWVW